MGGGRIGRALVAMVLACACNSHPPRHVVLITIDTLRADHLGLYGYRHPTSPFIDSLAAESTVFDEAVAPSPVTAPSVASILTGLNRASHGVRANGESLPAYVPTLAEMLKAHGFRTMARIANPLLDAPRGFGRGFDDYAVPRTLVQRPPEMMGGSPVVEEALRLLDGAGDAPFFLWLHFYDPHGPYYPPAAYRDAFRAEDYRWPNEPAELVVSTDRNALFQIPKYQVVDDERAPSVYRARYDAEVRYTDDHVRAVVDGLRSRGLWDDTLFVLTADHGEGMGEHGYYFQHGWYVYEDCVWVPLLVRAPGRMAAGRRETRTVSLVDVAPTILALLDLPAVPEMEGRSLTAPPPPEPTAFTQSYHGSSHAGLRRGRYKYIFTPARSASSPPPAPEDEPILPAEPHNELYDLTKDPGELHDLSTSEPAVMHELRKVLQAWLADQHRRGEATSAREAATGGPRPLDPLVEGQLRALGYLN
ncbi:MAG TPA: sulfatase [Candidatus Eisenbacteria bacterium]|nr:sulfatase [Candidatus Eisenbacteria bacterium]